MKYAFCKKIEVERNMLLGLNAALFEAVEDILPRNNATCKILALIISQLVDRRNI